MREVTRDAVLTERWGEGLVAVPSGAQVEFDVRLESVHEGILVSGTAFADSEGVCGRCLDEISRPVEVEFQELFAYPDRKRAISRFETTLSISRLRSGTPSSFRFRFSRCAAPTAPVWIRRQASG